jgi:hypothetical protein
MPSVPSLLRMAAPSSAAPPPPSAAQSDRRRAHRARGVVLAVSLYTLCNLSLALPQFGLEGELERVMDAWHMSVVDERTARRRRARGRREPRSAVTDAQRSHRADSRRRRRRSTTPTRRRRAAPASWRRGSCRHAARPRAALPRRSALGRAALLDLDADAGALALLILPALRAAGARPRRRVAAPRRRAAAPRRRAAACERA